MERGRGRGGSGRGSVDSKADYYRRAETLEFGNKLRVWPNFWEWFNSGYVGGIRFRSRNRGSAAFTMGPPIPHGKVIDAYNDLLWNHGYDAAELLFCEPSPEDRNVIQGEVCRSDRGLELSWSTEPGITNREAMTRANYSTGLAAKMILEAKLDPADFECLMELLDEYPDHVVEFSAFSAELGVLRRRMVVWEVRKY